MSVIDAKFDYEEQVYKNAKGEVVEGEDWDFSCPKCHGPAKLTDISCYYEHYRCLNCQHGFNVN